MFRNIYMGNLIGDTHKLCKINNHDSYTKLNKLFK